MSGFLKCFVYLAVMGVFSFLLGRWLPKDWFRYDKFPYRIFTFEKNGKIYDKIYIRKWKECVPDMSKILPGMMPSKRLPGMMTPQQVKRMLQETCVAEFIHNLLCILGLPCIRIWGGAGGWVVYAVYVLGNIPFSLIQRYNRPKLIRIYQKLEVRQMDSDRMECEGK